MTSSTPHHPDLVVGPDGVARCAWPGLAHADYRDYHDREWGKPVHGEAALFERLCLEGFQAGLSWLVILRKRPAFRQAFAGFDPEVVAELTLADVEALMEDESIVRNRRKIEATIQNARATLALRATEREPEAVEVAVRGQVGLRRGDRSRRRGRRTAPARRGSGRAGCAARRSARSSGSTRPSSGSASSPWCS